LIGEILKEARKSKQLTLTGLAEQVGVTAGYLSKVERNLMEPSLPMLRVLTDSLGLTASALFLPKASDRLFVIRKSDRPTTRFSNLAAPCEMLTPYAWRSRFKPEIEALHMKVPAGSRISSDDISFDHDEFIYIVSGELEYRYGDEIELVPKGGGIFIPRKTGNLIQNPGSGEAEIIWLARTVKTEAEESELLIVKDKEDALSTFPKLKFLGEKIRSLRIERNETIASFAEKIDMTPAYVSKIERNLLEPSLPVLRKIADTLEIEIIYLLADAFPADVLISDEHDTKRMFAPPDSGIRYTAMTPSYLSGGGKPDFFIVRTELSGNEKMSEDFVVHDYFEFTLVLDGTIEYITDEGVYTCEKGDSIYMDRNVPHNMRNPNKKTCKMLAALGNISRHFGVTQSEEMHND
jgi:transcriptional regulator with XRE-family HTH domain